MKPAVRTTVVSSCFGVMGKTEVYGWTPIVCFSHFFVEIGRAWDTVQYSIVIVQCVTAESALRESCGFNYTALWKHIMNVGRNFWLFDSRTYPLFQSPFPPPTLATMSKSAPSSTSKQRDYDYLFKLVLIGDSGVGKSCLLLRFAVSYLWKSRIQCCSFCFPNDIFFVTSLPNHNYLLPEKYRTMPLQSPTFPRLASIFDSALSRLTRKLSNCKFGIRPDKNVSAPLHLPITEAPTVLSWCTMWHRMIHSIMSMIGWRKWIDMQRKGLSSCWLVIRVIGRRIRLWRKSRPRNLRMIWELPF